MSVTIATTSGDLDANYTGDGGVTFAFQSHLTIDLYDNAVIMMAASLEFGRERNKNFIVEIEMPNNYAASLKLKFVGNETVVITPGWLGQIGNELEVTLVGQQIDDLVHYLQRANL